MIKSHLLILFCVLLFLTFFGGCKEKEYDFMELENIGREIQIPVWDLNDTSYKSWRFVITDSVLIYKGKLHFQAQVYTPDSVQLISGYIREEDKKIYTVDVNCWRENECKIFEDKIFACTDSAFVYETDYLLAIPDWESSSCATFKKRAVNDTLVLSDRCYNYDILYFIINENCQLKKIVIPIKHKLYLI